MSLDVLPSGFSSTAAATLLKTMQSAISANSSFIASSGSLSIDASSRSTMSSDTMFSIIAAAEKSKAVIAATPSSSKSTSGPQSASDTSSESNADAGEAIGGAQALIDDPYFQKSYSLDQAAQNYYAQMNRLVKSMRQTEGETKPGQTNGQIIADTMKLTGDSAKAFAAAFDKQTLKVADAATLGIGAKEERTWVKSAGGAATGSGTTASIDSEAWMAWQKANPNSVWTDDEGYQGGGGLMFSW